MAEDEGLLTRAPPAADPGFLEAYEAGDLWRVLEIALKNLAFSKTLQELTIGTAIDSLIGLELDGKLTPEQVQSYTAFA